MGVEIEVAACSFFPKFQGFIEAADKAMRNKVNNRRTVEMRLPRNAFDEARSNE